MIGDHLDYRFLDDHSLSHVTMHDGFTALEFYNAYDDEIPYFTNPHGIIRSSGDPRNGCFRYTREEEQDTTQLMLYMAGHETGGEACDDTRRRIDRTHRNTGAIILYTFEDDEQKEHNGIFYIDNYRALRILERGNRLIAELGKIENVFVEEETVRNADLCELLGVESAPPKIVPVRIDDDTIIELEHNIAATNEFVLCNGAALTRIPGNVFEAMLNTSRCTSLEELFSALKILTEVPAHLLEELSVHIDRIKEVMTEREGRVGPDLFVDYKGHRYHVADRNLIKECGLDPCIERSLDAISNEAYAGLQRQCEAAKEILVGQLVNEFRVPQENRPLNANGGDAVIDSIRKNSDRLIGRIHLSQGFVNDSTTGTWVRAHDFGDETVNKFLTIVNGMNPKAAQQIIGRAFGQDLGGDR